MFSGVYWNQPVCPSIRVSVCVQNISFCQSAGRGIKSYLVTALVLALFILWCASTTDFVLWYIVRILLFQSPRVKAKENIDSEAVEKLAEDAAKLSMKADALPVQATAESDQPVKEQIGSTQPVTSQEEPQASKTSEGGNDVSDFIPASKKPESPVPINLVLRLRY